MSKFDEQIAEAIKRLNEAIKNYKSSKYPFYPLLIKGRKRRKKAWR